MHDDGYYGGLLWKHLGVIQPELARDGGGALVREGLPERIMSGPCHKQSGPSSLTLLLALSLYCAKVILTETHELCFGLGSEKQRKAKLGVALRR